MLYRTIKDLAEDRAALSAATVKAERVANFVFEGISKLQSSKAKYAGISANRRRFILAVNRVITITHVAATKAFLKGKGYPKEYLGEESAIVF